MLTACHLVTQIKGQVVTCIEPRTLSIGSQSAPFIVNADAAQTDRTSYYLPDSLGTHGTYEMAGMFPWHLPPWSNMCPMMVIDTRFPGSQRSQYLVAERNILFGALTAPSYQREFAADRSAAASETGKGRRRECSERRPLGCFHAAMISKRHSEAFTHHTP